MPMSRLQRFITKLVPPGWAVAMEAESREWMVRCPACGDERSIWDMGGIRWKSSGKASTWGRCPECRERVWHKVYRREPGGAPNPAVRGRKRR